MFIARECDSTVVSVPCGKIQNRWNGLLQAVAAYDCMP